VGGLYGGKGTIEPEGNLKTPRLFDLAAEPLNQQRLSGATRTAVIKEVPKEHGETKDQIVAINDDMTGKPSLESGVEAIGR
jgi:hypothetical protein